MPLRRRSTCVGKARSRERPTAMSPQLVMNIQPGHPANQSPARLVQHKQLRHNLAQSLRAIVRSTKRNSRHCVLQRASSHRMTLRMIGIQQAIR